MNITTFEAKDFEKKRNDGITVHVIHRSVIISAKVARMIGLKVSHRVLVHQDNSDNNIWYLSIDPKGFQLKPASRSSAVHINSTSLASLILDAFGLTEKTDDLYFNVEDKPIEHNGLKYWKLTPVIETT